MIEADTSLPVITIAMPTYNSESKIEKCLKLIRETNYPQDKIEIIIADGGSTDRTLEIAKNYNAVIMENKRKLPEPGKAVGIKNAKGSLICFLDDDNFVTDKDFFLKMSAPFNDPEISASEPWEYTYDKTLKPLERYWAITGLNDPIMYYIGCYDRVNALSGKWTSLKLDETDEGEYIKIRLNEERIPTIGANGFMVRTEVIRKTDYENLLDMDKLADMVRLGYNTVAKVKCGVVHTFVGDMGIYWKKVIRKAKSFYGDVTFQSSGQAQKEETERLYKYPNIKSGIIKFSLSTILIIPNLYQTLKLFVKTKDTAALLHFPINVMTFIGYALKTLKVL